MMGNAMKRSLSKLRVGRLSSICVLLIMALMLACGQQSKPQTSSVPIDTTVVDDDTLEGANAPIPTHKEHAR